MYKINAKAKRMTFWHEKAKTEGDAVKWPHSRVLWQ
jgi:hypothetical protein